MIHKLLSLSGLFCLMLLMLGGCRGGDLYDVDDTRGRLTGELIIVGPINRNLDLVVGVTRIGRDDTIEEAPLGRLVSAVTARLDGRSVAFDFTDLPIGSYNIVLTGTAGGTEKTYFRSDRVQLTHAAPELTGLSQEISLTGPAPWGTISGTLLLSGARPTSTDMLLFVTDDTAESFRYEFNMWDADFGVMYFAIGGLSAGEYSLGLSDPVDHQMLGFLADTVTISKVQPNPDGVMLWGEYPVPQSTEARYSLGGKIELSAPPPATANLALIAVQPESPDLGTSPIYHIRPELLDAELQVPFFLDSLAEGEYDLQVYALDFSSGNHQVIGGLAESIVLEGETRFLDRIQVPADISLIR